jgi:hypothetical protein
LPGSVRLWKPLDRDKTVDAREIVAQRRGQIEVMLLFAVGGPDFEDDGNHVSAHAAAPSRDY